jgi:hypothetical protein
MFKPFLFTEDFSKAVKQVWQTTALRHEYSHFASGFRWQVSGVRNGGPINARPY